MQVALEELCIEGNMLHYLPVSLWSLRQLQVLNAARNRIEWLRYASSLLRQHTSAYVSVRQHTSATA